jgi:hypothetical protein
MVLANVFSSIFFRSQVFKRRGAYLAYSQAQEKIFLFLHTSISDTPLTCWRMHPWYWFSPIRSITSTDFIQEMLRRIKLANAPSHILNRGKTLILWFKLILCQLWLFKSHLTPVLLRLSLFWKGRKLRLNVELSNRMQPTAFGKLQKVAANRRFRVAGRAKFRTRQELPRSEWPISHQFATRSASERELYATSP